MMRHVTRVVAIVLFFLQATLSYAQEAAAPTNGNTPLMGSEASPALPSTTVAPALSRDGEIYRILVIGDSLAGGLGAGITRVAQDKAEFEILNRFNESSGLARKEVYDWSAALDKIVATKPVDAIVVLVGMNDRQEIRDGNIRHVFKSPDWVKRYSANVDSLIDSVQAANAKLFWISVPPMANATFDADMRYVSDIHRQRVAAKQGHYVDVRPFFLGPDGSYIDRGLDDLGNDRKLRDSDGIKFMKVGNNRFGQLVLGAIKAIGNNDQAAQVAVATQPVEKPVTDGQAAVVDPGVKVVTEPPSFGQAGLDGETLVFRADSLKAPAPQQTSVAQRTSGQNPAVQTSSRFSAKPGSRAEQLLVKGVIGVAPQGRFDDFSMPVAQ